MNNGFDVNYLLKNVKSELRSKMVFFTIVLIALLLCFIGIKRFTRAYYSSTGVVTSRLLTNIEMQVLLSELSQSIENEDFKYIYRRTGLPKDKLIMLKGLDVEIYENDASAVSVEVEVYNPEALKMAEDLIIEFIKSNRYYAFLKSSKVNTRKAMISKIEKEIKKWSSKEIVDESLIGSTILIEKSFSDIIESKLQIIKLMEEIEAISKISFIKPITLSNKDRSYGYMFYAFVAVFLWAVIVFTYLFFYILFIEQPQTQ